MVSFPELRDSEPSVFTRQAQKWQDLANQVTARGKDLDEHLAALADWEGAAADTAKATLTTKRTALGAAAEQLDRIPPVLHGLGATLQPLHDQLHTVMSTARDNDLEIETDGMVKHAPLLGFIPDPFVDKQKKQLAAQLTTEVQGLLRQATTADEQAAGRLHGLTAQATGLAPAAGDTTVAAAATAIPGPNTSPADVHKWWTALSPTQQESLLFMHPDQIGNLDGIPVAVRDRANRDTLDELRAKLGEQQSRLQARPQPLSEDDSKQLHDIQGKLGGINAIENRLGVTPSAATQRPYLMKISADGSGRAVVAMGDPDTASNVATYVPGTGASLAGCGGDLTRSDRMVAAATMAGSPSTSVITWIGYDAPPTIPHAVLPGYAEHAEHDLGRFEDGLRATHDGAPSHNSVIGHSYGTTVVGYAARDGALNANDLVFVASPGVGVDSASGLHLDGVPAGQMSQHVFATTAQHDMIHLADGVFGPNPSDSGFGATDFGSAPGTAGPWYEGGYSGAAHSQYWDPGNKALNNMGSIIAGKKPSE